jgi:hypothetical protein
MGGKSSPPPPDYGPLADASRESAAMMAGLGRDQLAFSKRQYEEMAPLARRAADQQFATQNELMQMGREDRERYLTTFAPVEEGLVRRAQEFDTEAYREQLASQAAADAARAFGNTLGMTSRGLARMGVTPGSGASMAQMNQNALAGASMRAGAMTGSRLQSEGEGMNRLYNAAALGRGLPGQTLGAYGSSVGAGSAGIQTAMAPGTQYMQGMGQGANTIGSGRSMLQSGLGNVLSSQTSAYNAGMSQQGLDVGGLMQGGAALYTAFSDRRLKKNIELVGRDERTMLPLYEFEYKDGDGRVFLGVMADDVQKVYPDMVVVMPNGFMAVNYAGLGIELMEVGYAA